MQSATRHQLRGPVAGLVALACFGTLVSASAAARRTESASRSVRLALSDSGQARWSIQGDSDQGSLALNYKWTGSFAFTVPTAKLNNPTHAHLAVKAVGTLTGTWVGDLVGTRYSAPNTGKYHCSYSGTNIKIRVNAQLVAVGKRLQLIMRRGSGKTMSSSGFFPDIGGGAKADCSNTVGAAGPTHFAPSWLFRDTTSDNGAFSSAQATITFPSTLLPGGRATVTFPHEVGSVSSAMRDRLAWKNTGRVVATAR
jgi:hypothetical protein